MIKYVYYRHHEKHEEDHQDNKMISVMERIMHDFEFGETAFVSLSLNDGVGTVLTEIEEVEWHLKRLKEEGVKDK